MTCPTSKLVVSHLEGAHAPVPTPLPMPELGQQRHEKLTEQLVLEY